MRIVRALAALAVVASVTPAAAQPDPEADVVRVDVRAMTTALVPESTKLVIRARAVNTSTDAVRRLRVGLRFGAALRGRSAIEVGGTPARFGTRVAERDMDPDELAPGGTTEVEFDVPVGDLPFDRSTENGVYPMRIEVRERSEVVGAVDTYVMWWPRLAPKVRVAWVWPLAEPSHRAIGDDFFDDGLAAVVDGGRLDTLLRVGAGGGLPLTWAVDPEVVDALSRMTKPYTVRGEEGTNAAAARAWLDRARTALRSASILPLPYGDLDLVATSSAPKLAAEASRAFRLGREVLRRDLGNAGTPQLAWPPGDTLAQPVEALLSGQGVKGVVVPAGAMPLTEPLYYTPTAPAPLTTGALGSMTALVADAQLSRWVAQPTGQEGPRLAAQRFIADAAMMAMERPGDTRDVVVTPPRTWEPVRGFATQLLAQTVAAPWLDPVTLDSVLAGEPSAAARTRTPAAGSLLDQAQLDRVVAQRGGLERVRGILTDPKRAPEELTNLDDALLRAVSSRWAADPGGGKRLTDAVDASVGRQLGRLRIVQGGVVTMTGRTGRIPLTFENDLGQPVRIRVRVDTKQRLEITGATTYDSRNGGEVAIPPGTSTLVIPGKATTGGLFRVNVELLSNDGTPLGIATTVSVRSTVYGAVALGITAVAFGLLLVASATRLVQRRRRAGSPRPEEPRPIAA